MKFAFSPSVLSSSYFLPLIHLSAPPLPFLLSSFKFLLSNINLLLWILSFSASFSTIIFLSFHFPYDSLNFFAYPPFSFSCPGPSFMPFRPHFFSNSSTHILNVLRAIVHRLCVNVCYFWLVHLLRFGSLCLWLTVSDRRRLYVLCVCVFLCTYGAT